MDDEAILARLDGEPDAFAGFYRRHVAALYEHFLSRTNDPGRAAALCAETFAAALDAAHRFDASRGTAEAWLYAIAGRQLAHAEPRAAAGERSRRRLGMAPLELGDGFAAELEEELVAAARYRAQRRRQRVALPRMPVRGALAAAVALAVVAALAALALNRGGDDRAAHERRTARPSSFVLPLVPMLEPVSCRGLDARGESAFDAAAELALLTNPRRRRDQLWADAASNLPVRTFHPADARLAAHPRLRTRLHVGP